MSEYLDFSKQYKKFDSDALSYEKTQYLHKRTVEMFSVVKSLFEKEKIRYSIVGGTLLGAYKNSRFIPWDEDFDVCIFEEDYDRAKKVLLENLPADMILQCKETEPNYYHGWMKVRDMYSKIHPFEDAYNNNGVWVDLYKLKKVKTKKVPAFITKEHLDYLKRRKQTGGISKKEYWKRVKKNHLYSTLLKQMWNALVDRDNSFKRIICSASKVAIDPEIAEKMTTYTFEGIEVSGFLNAEVFLKEHYGDRYMELPPVEKRRISINDIEIGEQGNA